MNHGSIKLGGIDIRDYTLDSLLANISMVFQNVYLFQDSVINNIRFGKPDATMEEVEVAAKAACCHDFIMSLPNGYETIIGEGGSTLSGGEIQRCKIAKCLNSSLSDLLYILDEPSAGLHNHDIERMRRALEKLRDGGNTVVLVEHHRKMIEMADHNCGNGSGTGNGWWKSFIVGQL